MTEKEKRALIEKETETRILNYLSQLDNYGYVDTFNFNIDSLNQIVTDELAEYLRHKPFPINAETENLKQENSPDNKFSIFTFWYYSGGAEEYIHTSILQWKKADGTYGVKVLGFPANYYQIHVLTKTNSKNLYLLFGDYKKNRQLNVAIHQVFELSQDNMNVNYPAFYNQYSTLAYFDDIYSPELPLPNFFGTCVVYSAETKEIIFKYLGSEDRLTLANDGRLHSQVIIRGRAEIRYIFDGKKFVER